MYLDMIYYLKIEQHCQNFRIAESRLFAQKQNTNPIHLKNLLQL